MIPSDPMPLSRGAPFKLRVEPAADGSWGLQPRKLLLKVSDLRGNVAVAEATWPGRGALEISGNEFKPAIVPALLARLGSPAVLAWVELRGAGRKSRTPYVLIPFRPAP